MIPVHGLLRQEDHECLANLVQKKIKKSNTKENNLKLVPYFPVLKYIVCKRSYEVKILAGLPHPFGSLKES